MRVDPVAAVVQFLRSVPELAPVSVTGDLTSRETGTTTVYVEHNGGFRLLRDCEDRADIYYEVYSLDREEAADLAFLVREALLEQLPGTVVGTAYVLDVEDSQMPDYEPDGSSREHVYCGEVSIFYTAS
jgi:hypothetical protein